MNTFTTQTNEKKNARFNLITAVVITTVPWAAVAIYSLLQTTPSWDLLGIASACYVLVLVVLASQIKINNIYTLRFEGNVLYLDGKTKNAHYQVYDIPASDFVLKQSKADVAQNSCSMRIKHTVFYNLKYVENYSELKKYIEDNFPKQ